MTSDLLFSVLPREGKVPIAHDSQKVAQVEKQEKLRSLSDEEKELKGEERDARKKQQQQKENEQDSEQEANSEQVNLDNDELEKQQPKGPKHLDIYV
ncbi:hypothetical protein [uncultured Paraglaciecola sp.]|uniref:hypothetical protein n=1 Tax=uncultured Paraglaciecola sp. TaxID=1765024 RepID=UPI002604FA61|nr:hypothetical protein [uncultured Paraglaciecola sp.]